ncbi:sigma-70 family RNA polymerase sigma factor [Dactylosporangium sp. NPDC048998]|uniref:sigma-70 family RNA polymerase sigma factor n=1 Tax=Dactylosporangium sp. NPDC048998 TaxID=3363976 RepID=UPI0037249A75
MRLADTTRRTALRNRLVERHLRLAEKVAARYCHDPRAQDIRQVAALALVEAAGRFDPGRGVPFSAYATHTLTGALKRYIRDNRWALHTPRHHGEVLARVADARDRLTQHLGRDPTAAETATATRCRESDVTSSLRVLYEQHMLSLDGPAGPDDGTSLADTLADDTDETATIDDREALHTQLRRLPRRELRVVVLRFYGNRTYAEIGEEVGRSATQVSRLLRTALDRLRAALDGPATPPRQVPRRRHRPAPASAPRPAPIRPAGTARHGTARHAAPPARNGGRVFGGGGRPPAAKTRRRRSRPPARGPPSGPDGIRVSGGSVFSTVRGHRRRGSTPQNWGQRRTSVAPTRGQAPRNSAALTADAPMSACRPSGRSTTASLRRRGRAGPSRLR